MASLGSVAVIGKSGRKYDFEVYEINLSWDIVPAVYIVTRRSNNSKGGYKHTAIYIGQTDNLQERFENHHKQDCFDRYNANCLCIYEVSVENTRLAIEDDLLSAHRTECNDKPIT